MIRKNTAKEIKELKAIMTKIIVNGQIVEQPPAQLKSIELFYALTLSRDRQIGILNDNLDTSYLNKCTISLVHKGTCGQNDLIKVLTPSSNVIYYVGQWNNGLVNPPKKKPIVLKSFLGRNETIERAIRSKPTSFNYIELLIKDYLTDTDLIYCYDNPDDKSNGTLYLGNWNDGVVE